MVSPIAFGRLGPQHFNLLYMVFDIFICFNVSDHSLELLFIWFAQEVVLCGRIACEGLEGKLNERSLLLEGRASAGGASTRLSVSECPAVSVFPGLPLLGGDETTRVI